MVESRTGDSLNSGEDKEFNLDKEITHEITDLPLEKINVAPQFREKFEIEALSVSIAESGLIMPLLVTRIKEKECQKYLEDVNDINKTDKKIDDFERVKIEGQIRFYLLIDGERRLRAIKSLPKEVFREKFPNGKVKVILYKNITAKDIFNYQSQTNEHMRIPPEREAIYYQKIFFLRRKINKNYSLAEFAREMGRTTETIKNRLRFANLPDEIQKYAFEKDLPYGVLVEIGKLKEELNLGADELNYWAQHAIVHQVSVPDFRKRVKNHIQNIKSGQSVLDLFTESQLKQERKLNIKKTVEQKTVLHLWESLHYFNRVIKLFEKGELGLEDSPFSTGSPARFSLAEIERIENLLPLLEKDINKKAYLNAKKIIEKSKGIAEKVTSQQKEKTLYQAKE